VAISARWWFIASVSHRGMTSASPLPSLGQIAPKIRPTRFSDLSPRRARSALGPTAGDLTLLADPRLVGEPDSIAPGSTPFSPPISSGRMEKLF
jgi:hypothetical protein